MRNSETVQAPGGVALVYSNDDYADIYIETIDDRPISPLKNSQVLSPKRDRRDRESESKLGKPVRAQYENYYEKAEERSPRSKSLKKLHNRDKKIALKRREKLESARSNYQIF